ncbi:sulfite exporter TauE/SafE family protein [Aurantibacter crassamenti]|uniref:sulfite exporter TauE/SafE family protein n=1 Tax=Aurantibacter crassamenti TaxID=1837375 RepID=UPI001939D0D3|nr:sulfite exporter TauE/SafE family protein [Aurantibacter crassamenti]MBM1105982.1 sulfite exporter TauE/SafE family protein [Aurantibacter crassamenti]
MEIVHILGYFGALTIGLVLGLLGGGGSIMAIPIFTYLFQISPITTTAYSLFVVGTSASIGALKNFKNGLIDFKVALVFAIPAFITVFIARRFVVPMIPENLAIIGEFVVTKNMGVMLLFSGLMLVASLTMIRKKEKLINEKTAVSYNYPLLILGGIIIGFLTGLAGIGGGFLIIPVLVFMVKLPMKNAVATSLFIIALKSLIGFFSGIEYLEINWVFLLIFTLISSAGIFIGVYLATFINSENLKKGFGWFVLLMAICVFFKEMIASL